MHDPSFVLVFIEIVERGSISAAARALGITRSTASRRLAALEERLGVQLMNRTTQSWSLTRAGEAYYVHASEARALLRSAEDAALQAHARLYGSLRLAMPVLDTERLVLPLLSDFASQFPDIRVEMAVGFDVRDLVARGFDIGLQSGLEHNSSLRMRKLLVDEVILVASPAYLSRRGTPERIEDLDGHDFLVQRSLDDSLEAWGLEGGGRYAPTPARLVANARALIVEAALAGMGLGAAPRVLVEPALERGDLVHVLPAHVTESEWISLVYAATRIVPPKVRTFLDFTTAWAARNHLRPGGSKPG